MSVTINQIMEMAECVEQMAHSLWWEAWAIQCLVCPDRAADKIDFTSSEDRATQGCDPSAGVG